MDMYILAVLMIPVAYAATMYAMGKTYKPRTSNNDVGVIKYKPTANGTASFCSNRGHVTTRDYRYHGDTNILEVKLFDDLVIPDGLALVVTQVPAVIRDTSGDGPYSETISTAFMSPSTHVISSGSYYKSYTTVTGSFSNEDTPMYHSLIRHENHPELAFKLTIISAPVDTGCIAVQLRED